MFGLLKNRFSFPTCPQVCQYTQLPSCRYQNSDKVHLCVLSHKQCLRSRCREIGCDNHIKCAGCPFSLPCSPIFGVPLNHFLRLLFKMQCWNSIALLLLCTALDKIPPSVSAANQTSVLWRCLVSVSGPPPAVDCRECQEAAAADSPAYPSLPRAETLQTLQCLSYAPSPLCLTVTSLLIPAVSCSLSPSTTAYPFVC